MSLIYEFKIEKKFKVAYIKKKSTNTFYSFNFRLRCTTFIQLKISYLFFFFKFDFRFYILEKKNYIKEKKYLFKKVFKQIYSQQYSSIKNLLFLKQMYLRAAMQKKKSINCKYIYF